MKFAIIPNLPFLNNPKDLDPSYKTDLDLWDCFGRKKLRLITEEIGYHNHSGVGFIQTLVIFGFKATQICKIFLFILPWRLVLSNCRCS